MKDGDSTLKPADFSQKMEPRNEPMKGCFRGMTQTYILDVEARYGGTVRMPPLLLSVQFSGYGVHISVRPTDTRRQPVCMVKVWRNAKITGECHGR
jgi:hypothetical protein